MGDKPINLYPHEVKAILDGRMTQMRRALKPQPATVPGKVSGPHQDCETGEWGMVHTAWQYSDTLGNYEPAHDRLIPFRVYKPGDRLWCREAWVRLPKTAYGLPKIIDPGDHDMAAYYRAGFDRSGKKVWRSSIHMPRWASRITLIVTDVRVQRVQEISGDDCVAEGLRHDAYSPMGVYYEQRTNKPEAEKRWQTAMVQQFHDLWDSINGNRPGCDWQSNPWVAAYSFKPILQNIDAIT